MSDKERSPAFQFYARDWLSSSKVQRMSMTERGVYITLLTFEWLDGSLPTDMKQLAGMVKMKPAQLQRMWAGGALAECFVEQDGRFINPKLEEVRQGLTDYIAGQSESGRKGAATRWGRHRNVEGSPKRRHSDPIDSLMANDSSSSSSSSSREGEAATPPAPARPMAPIHDRSHHKHVVCGRVCLHMSQFDDFTRRRGDREAVRKWAEAIVDDWTAGAHAGDEPGDGFDFWRARYAETWPPSAAAIGTKAKPVAADSYVSWADHPSNPHRGVQ